MAEPPARYPDIEVVLSGTDGNAFALIGRVRRVIENEVGRKEGLDAMNYLTDSESYDELLIRIHQMVTVL